MSTEIPILYNEIKKEFNTALKNAAEGDYYLPRPKALDRYARLRRSTISQMRETNLSSKRALEKKSTDLTQEYDINKLNAMSVVLEVREIEKRLGDNGVFFGNEVFNFSIDRVVISKDEEIQIKNASNNIMAELQKLGRFDLTSLFANLPMYPTESRFEKNSLIPNAARIDFILTNDGPKIIEVNSQWVDAINALSGFATVFGDNKTVKNVMEKFAQSFPRNTSLALVNIQQTTGSRELGATLELENLAGKLLKTNLFRKCEVVDPNKVRLSYLNSFDSFYLNFDPRAVGYEEPDWIDLILKKIGNNPNSVFPKWRPLLDKKMVLTQIPNSESYLVPTTPFLDYQDSGQPVVLKGDGYSLNSVTTSYDENFPDSLKLAQKDPDSYVIQPFIEGKKFSGWVYDSSSKKIKYLTNGFTKLNVWWMNGQVVGMLATVSDSPTISDKDYNIYPLIK